MPPSPIDPRFQSWNDMLYGMTMLRANVQQKAQITALFKLRPDLTVEDIGAAFLVAEQSGKPKDFWAHIVFSTRRDRKQGDGGETLAARIDAWEARQDRGPGSKYAYLQKTWEHMVTNQHLYPWAKFPTDGTARLIPQPALEVKR